MKIVICGVLLASIDTFRIDDSGRGFIKYTDEKGTSQEKAVGSHIVPMMLRIAHERAVCNEQAAKDQEWREQDKQETIERLLQVEDKVRQMMDPMSIPLPETGTDEPSMSSGIVSASVASVTDATPKDTALDLSKPADIPTKPKATKKTK